MAQMGTNPSLIHWYWSFLTNGQQLVRVNNTYSPMVTSSCKDVFALLCSSRSIPAAVFPLHPDTRSSDSPMRLHW